jgi:hypothetical protein
MLGDSLGKNIIIFGIIIIVLGIIVSVLPKGNGLPKLPGDIYIKKDNFVFYFPWVSSILISVILSLIFYLFFRK